MLTPLLLETPDDVVYESFGEWDKPTEFVPAHPLLFGEPHHEVAYEGELFVAGPLLWLFRAPVLRTKRHLLFGRKSALGPMRPNVLVV